ncbi:MAG: hypothetical protein ACHQET_04620 [Chitinophagales bacterium]
MKLNFSIKWLLAFLALIFLIIECHDWFHVAMARILCGCWGNKGFEDWKICDSCVLGKGERVAIGMMGPLLNYILIWTGWFFMESAQPPARKSLGFFLLYASNPLPRILAAKSGGTDETNAFRTLFQDTHGSNHYGVALSSLIMILILTIPPLIRSIGLIKGLARRAILIPSFLIVPMYLDRWIIQGGLAKMLHDGILSGNAFLGTSWLVIAWFGLIATVLILTRKSLSTGLVQCK